MNEAMIFTVGLTLGLVLSMLMKPGPSITIANSLSLDPYDDDTDPLDDDDEDERAPWREYGVLEALKDFWPKLCRAELARVKE